MTNLISGKEALIALANGEEVEGNIGSGWVDISVDQKLSIRSFITETNDYGDAVQFRLKPRTITINGIEVPAPFEPKVGEKYWFIADYVSSGYSDTKEGTGINSSIGKWKTEEEIRQVVAALRQIFREKP